MDRSIESKTEAIDDEYTLVFYVGNKGGVYCTQCHFCGKCQLKEHKHTAPSTAAFSEKYLETLDYENFGRSAFYGANIYDSRGEYVGALSYNGRFWPKDHEYGQKASMNI